MQDHPRLYNNFEASLGYMRPCLSELIKERGQKDAWRLRAAASCSVTGPGLVPSTDMLAHNCPGMTPSSDLPKHCTQAKLAHRKNSLPNTESDAQSGKGLQLAELQLSEKRKKPSPEQTVSVTKTHFLSPNLECQASTAQQAQSLPGECS